MAQKDYSEKTAQEVDEYIKSLLDERYKDVKFKLNEHKDVIEAMVKDLREKEVISGDRVNELIEEYSTNKKDKNNKTFKKELEAQEKRLRKEVVECFNATAKVWIKNAKEKYNIEFKK